MQKMLKLIRFSIIAFNMLLICVPLHGQIDQFHSQLVAMPNDTVKVRTIHSFLRENQNLPPDTVFSLAQKGWKLAKQLEDQKGMAFLNLYLGFSKIDNGEYKSALPFLAESARLHLMRKDSLNWAKVLVNQGLLHYLLGNEDQALIHYQQAAAVFDQMEVPNAALFNNMAIIYRKQKKYEFAIELYTKSLLLKRASKDSLGIAASLMNLGSLYGIQGDSTQAIELELQAIELYEALNREADLASTSIALGKIYQNMNQLKEAQVYFDKAYKYFSKHPESEYYHTVLAYLGDLSMDQESWAEAEIYYRKALKSARAKNQIEEVQMISKILSQTLHEQQKNAEAWDLLWESMKLKDTLTISARLALTEEMQARFEVGQAEQKNIQQQRITWGILGIFTLITVGILYFLFQKNRTNRLLKHKNSQINQALFEKEELMKEMHHRVKNNLQFISSLLRLQTRHIEDEKAQEVLLASRNRVLSMALIHRHLYQDQQLTTIQMDTYLDRLLSELISSFENPMREVVLDTDFDPILLDVDQAVPLGLIVNELVCNAMKYAFFDREIGHLFVSLKKSEGDLILMVSDNGPGWDTSVNGVQGTSFGYRLIQLLTEKLHAELQIKTENGTSISLRLPESTILS